MRRARHKSESEAFYHITTRVGGSPGYYPLQRTQACLKLIDTIYGYVQAYCSKLVSFEIMGSHYHFIVFMEQFRRLSRQELKRRAELVYGKRARRKTAHWGEKAWQRFNRKLFDVSALMQHINGEYGKWFNRRYSRQGHFWGGRFKSPELLDAQALQDCLLYIELNAVRAGLVRRPEQWRASSTCRRFQGKDEGLMALEQIFPGVPSQELWQAYRQLLKEGVQQVRRERVATGNKGGRSIEPSNPFGRRQRFFSQGIVIGSALGVLGVLKEYQLQGHYRRRKRPIPQLGGRLYTLRRQRPKACN